MAKTLMENAALLHALVHNAIDGIITIDDFGIIESINPSGCKLFGYAENEVIGNNVSMLMLSSDAEVHDKHLHQYKKTGGAHIIGVGRELMGRTKAGYQFPFKLGVSEVNMQVGKYMPDLFMTSLNKKWMRKA